MTATAAADDLTISKHLIFALDHLTVVAAKAFDPANHDDIAAQVIRLNQIMSKLELILSAVHMQRPYKFRSRL